MIKLCSKCKKEKELNEFYNDKTKATGKGSYCIVCSKIYNSLPRGRERSKRYARTEKRKSSSALHKKSDRYKETVKALRSSIEYKQRLKEYVKNNILKIRETKRKYKKSEKGQITELKYRYSDKGHATSNKNALRYSRTPKGKMSQARANHKRRMRTKNAPSTLTHLQWNQILKEQNNYCNMCRNSFKNIKPTRDHIIPVSKGGGLTKKNVQALCQSCNSSKGNKIGQE